MKSRPRIIHVLSADKYRPHWGYHDTYIPKYQAETYDVHVVYADYKEQLHHSGYFEEITLHGMPTSKYHEFFPKLEGLERKLEELKPDIIYLHGGQCRDQLGIKNYVKNNGVIWVVDYHGDPSNTAKNVLSRYSKHLLWKHIINVCSKYVHANLYITSWVRDWTHRLYGCTGIPEYIVPLGVDDRSLVHTAKREQSNLLRDICSNNQDKIVITGGKFERNKNIHRVVHALRDMTGVQVLVFGDGIGKYATQLKELINASHNARNLGWLNQRDIQVLFEASDLAVFPGNQSVLWQHALGAGVQIICKWWPGSESLVFTGGVRFYKELSEENIHTAVRDMLKMNVNRGGLARRTRELIGYSKIKRDLDSIFSAKVGE